MSTAKSAGSDIIKLLDPKPEIDADSTGGKIIDSATTSSLKIHTSDTLPVLGSVFCVTSRSKLNVAPMLLWLAPPVQEKAQREFIPKMFPSHWFRLYLHSIQLIERFYDPLAGDVYVGYISRTSVASTKSFFSSMAKISR